MKTISLLFLLFLFSTTAFSQYSYKIIADGRANGCPSRVPISNTVIGSLTVTSTSSSVQGIIYESSYSAAFDLVISPSGSFSCKCNGEPGCSSSGSASLLNRTIRIPVPTSLCQTFPSILSGIGTNYELSLDLVVFQSSTPAIRVTTAPTDVCGANTISLEATGVVSSYGWEVSKGSSGVYTLIKSTTAAAVTISQAELIAAGFSNPGGQFFFRVRNPDCFYNSVGPSIEGVFRALPPTGVSITSTRPSCPGRNDGSITVSGISGSVPNYDVNLMVRQPDGSYGNVGDTQHVSATSVTTFSKAILGDLYEIRAGSYGIKIMNNFDVGNLGSCFVIYTESNDSDLGIADPQPLTLSPNTSSLVSCNSANAGTMNNGTITLTVGNGVSPFTYVVTRDGIAFTPSLNDVTSRSPVFFGLTKGNYKFIVTDANSCSSTQTASITIIEPPVLTVSNNPPTDVLCKGKSTGAIDLNVGGGNDGYTYSWSATGLYAPYTIPPSEDISGIQAGIYSVTVTDARGCNPTSTPHVVTIAEPTIDFTATAAKVTKGGGFDMTCALNDGEVSLGLANETLPLNPTLSTWKRDGTLFAVSDLLNPEDLTPGNYEVTIIDADGCDASATFTLNPHPGITVLTRATSSFNGYNTKCPASDEGGGEVYAVTNGFGTLNYVWPNATVGPVITDLVPGTYNVTVTDDNGCSDSEVLIIIGPPAIQPNLQIDSNFNGAKISCPGGADGSMKATPVNGFGNYRYAWAHDPGLTLHYANNLSQGTYTVTVMDDYDCVVQQSLGIKDPVPMDLFLTKKNYNGSDLSCHDVPDGEMQVSVVNGATPYAYAWSNGATSQMLNSLAPGDYEVIVTDANNCTQSSIASIVNPDVLTVTLEHINNFNSFDISCHGLADGSTKAVPAGGTAPYNYSWSNGVVDDLNSAIMAGDYGVHITDANGCMNSGTITLTEPPLFAFDGNVDNPVSCFGLADGQVNLTSSGGVTPYEYSRDQLSWQSQAIFATLDFGTKDFYSRDANGCVRTIQKVIAQPDVLTLRFQNIVDATCNNPIGSAQVIATGGNGGYSYNWFDDISNQSVNSGDVLQNAVAGIYRAEIRDAKNCTVSDLVAISSVGGAISNIDNITGVSCFGFKDGSSSVSVVSGVAPFTFLWSDGQTAPAANGLFAGRSFITITDGLNCKTIKQVIIPTPDLLVSQYAKTLPLCGGDCNGDIRSIPVGGTAPYQLEWLTLNKTADFVNNLCAGSYDLRITDAQGCVFTEKVELTNPDPLKVVSELAKPICLGRCDGSISLTGTGGTAPYSFTWESGSVATSITDLCPGNYKVRMIDSHNCLINEEFVLPSGDALPIDLGTKATLCVGQAKVLNAGDQWAQSNWTSNVGFTSTASVVSIKEPGTYYFKGINPIGCIGLDTFKLETSLDLLKAEFIAPAQAFVGDTLVAIDISWPLPERVEWSYPASFKALKSSIPEILNVLLPQAGTFTLGMKSFLAECRDLREKTIIVLEKENSSSGGRLGYTDTRLIQEFSLYPNPNDGKFQIRVLVSQEMDINLKVLQFPTGILKSEFTGNFSSNYYIDFDLPDLPQGLYIVLLRVEKEEKFLRFFKN